MLLVKIVTAVNIRFVKYAAVVEYILQKNSQWGVGVVDWSLSAGYCLICGFIYGLYGVLEAMWSIVDESYLITKHTQYAIYDIISTAEVRMLYQH